MDGPTTRKPHDTPFSSWTVLTADDADGVRWYFHVPTAALDRPPVSGEPSTEALRDALEEVLDVWPAPSPEAFHRLHRLLTGHDSCSHAEARATPPALGVLRDQIRALYDFRPDDSHGEGYVNRGVVMALRVIEEADGRSFEGMCQMDGDPDRTATVWCLTHGGPMPRQVLWCDFAERPYEWRDEAIAQRKAARLTEGEDR